MLAMMIDAGGGPSLAHDAPRISQYWNTDDVPDYVADLITTFRDGNPDFQHRLFNEAEAEGFISRHFGPREAAAFRACAVPSMQSDYFRYCSVLALGGVYADADYRCVRSLRPLIEESTGGEIFLGPTEFVLDGREAKRIWSAFFAFREPGHPFLELALEIATANIEARIAERVWPVGEKIVQSIWLTAGPGIFTLMRFIRDWGSLEVFLERIVGTEAEPFGELYCEVIGSFERIHTAFDGVRVSPFDRLSQWVVHPDHPLPYKDTDVHWHNVRTSIFR
jgi:Glycosyltransferase sugar-binding region containing DXD motif